MYSVFISLLDRKQKKPIDVSKATGISPSTFSDWKSGKSTPNADKLVKIARYLGTTVEYLVTGESSEPLPPVMLSEEEESLLAAYRSLNTAGKEKTAEYIRDLTENDRYIKDTPGAGTNAG